MALRDSTHSRLVYSTEQGKACPKCGKPVAACACAKGKGCPTCGKPAGACACGKKSTAPKSDGVVRIMRQTKGRKGSGVCLVTGLPLPQAELEKLAKQLKQRCGAGGAVKDGVIEIQGDHRETLMAELQKLGYTVKLAGG